MNNPRETEKTVMDAFASIKDASESLLWSVRKVNDQDLDLEEHTNDFEVWETLFEDARDSMSDDNMGTELWI